ncbi:MAG TPA: hypothetical protein VHB46_18585 [Burkholderiales bacterium]|nr:hypothetical protein [Burkholderiales bacterium]
MNVARQWEFVADMNHSGDITISDVWLWIKWIYFWPGDALIYVLLQKAPELAAFLELSTKQFGGPLSLFLSFALWVLFVVLFILTWRLMDRTGARAAEALRRPFLKKQ